MTNDKQIEAMRVTFEEWCIIKNPQRSENHPTEYDDNLVQAWWLAWQAAIAATHEQYKPLVEALEKLARLGNEPKYGNSTGNMIARQALASLPEELRG